jgi:coniferyl-aldehyde dehydrogenase
MIVRDEAEPVALRARLARMREAASRDSAPRLARRRADLTALERIVRGHPKELARAIAADFGGRSAHETELLELFPTLEAARHARRNLAFWMKPEPVRIAPYFWPARARILRRPLGVIGIIAAWNYPLLLTFGPLVGALAAGNRALLKMSELTPHTAELVARLVAGAFAPDHVGIVSGDARTGRAFAALPLDHLLFTGATETGRNVMRAAAANLTPVTLELGGKSPAIVGADAPIARAAARIMSGKCRNAGQTCIAPDYVLLPEGATDAFVAAARNSVVRRYPDLRTTPEYTGIVSDAHFARLTGLLDDAAAKGAAIVALHPQFDRPDAITRRMPPAIVTGVRDDMRIANEEIFGPILAARTYRTLDEAIAYVNARPNPLALYYFGAAAADVARVLDRTNSGGACINDVMLQFPQDALPFGGVGPSGMGAYHGRAGFETFSHRKAVFEQAALSGFALLEPPYGRRFAAILRMLKR